MNRDGVANFAWWGLLSALLLATPIIGTLAAIFTLIITLFSLGIVFVPGAVRSLREQPMILLFIVGFLLFAIISAMNAKALSDMIYIFNFTAFLLAVPAYLLARERAGYETAVAILTMCLFGAGIALVVALIDVNIRNLSRAEGFFSGAILFARVGVTLGFVAGMGFFLVRGPFRFLYLAGPAFGIIVTVLSQSRGTLIALPILALLYFFYALRRAQTIQARLIMVVILLAVGAMGFIVMGDYSARFSQLGNIVSQLFAGEVSLDESASIRLDFYKTGWTLFIQNPLFGYGWANMADEAFRILDPSDYPVILVEQFHFHNDFFNFVVAAGIFGFISLLAFLCGPLVGALYLPRDRLFAIRLEIILMIFALYVISGLTDMVIGYDLPTAMFAILSAVIVGAVRESQLLTQI